MAGSKLTFYSVHKQVNQTGCAPGLATDEVFFPHSIPGSCDTEIGGFIATAVIIIAARIYIAVMHTIRWIAREKQLGIKPGGRQQQQRLPIVPTLSWIAVIVYVLYWGGGGINLFNVRNGWTPFLFGIGYTVFAMTMLLYLSKLVSLGHRIAPKPKGPPIYSTAGFEKLSQFDRVGKITLFFCVMGVLGQLVLLSIVQMIPDMDQDVMIRAAVACQSLSVILCVSSEVYQIQRVKRAIRESIEPNKPHTSGQSIRDLELVAKKLTGQQILFLGPNPFAVAFQLSIAFGVLELRWYIPLILNLLDIVTGLVLILAAGAFKRPRQTSTSRTATPVVQVEERPETLKASNPIVPSGDVAS